MIIPDLKNRVMTVIARRSGKGEPITSPTEMKPEISKTEPGESDGRHEAAQDAMAAMAEKSPQKFLEAMTNLFELHEIHRSKKPLTDE